MKFKEFLGQDLDQELNEDVLSSLQRVVDALIHAGNVAQAAHWNLRSSAFVTIHPWFAETYNALFSTADDVAEQIKIANIDLMVNVNRAGTKTSTDEQELFLMVKNSLQSVKEALDAAATDTSLDRSLHGLIDDWTASITKMIWFIEASAK